MKVAFSVNENSFSANLESRFGRAGGFLIVDSETGDSEYLTNAQNMQAAQGAGIQSAQNVARGGAQAVVSGHFGPKAFRVLLQSGIAVYQCETVAVAQALELFKVGSLKRLQDADMEGHWI